MKSFALTLICLLLVTGVAGAQDAKKAKDDVWAPLRPLVGKWTGSRTDPSGGATQSVEWEFVLGEKFLRCKTTTLSGKDPHADIGFISFDKSRKKFVFRAFYSEGFVNQYVGEISDDGKTIVFETEAIENGPPKLRAMEIMKIDGNQLTQELKLSSGDKPYKRCVFATLKKEKR